MLAIKLALAAVLTDRIMSPLG